jgi:MFS family permease
MHPSVASPDRPLPSTIRGLGWTSFLTDLSSEAIYPLLPAFVMRELGGSAMSVGLLDGIANLVTAVVRLPSGALSDRVGRRPLILLGYGLSALVRPLMGLVVTPWGALVVPQAFIPLVWLVVSLMKSITATRAGRLSDRIRPRTALARGWLVFAAGYAGLAASGSLVTALPMMLVIGIAYGCAEPAERALVAALAPAGRQGGAFGWYALVQGAMALPAGLLAGWLWQQGPHGPSWAFGATAALSVLACGLLMAPIGPTVVGSE